MNELVEHLSPQEIGSRLVLVRQGLNLTQGEVAAAINTIQARISRIEKGYSVNSAIFLRLLAFYSQSVSLDVLFSEKIDFVTHENLFNKDFVLRKLLKEKYELLRISVEHELQQTATNLNRTLQEGIDLL